MTQYIEARIARLEAIEYIKQLKARYLLACDQRDFDGLRSCFVTSGLVINYGFIGKFTSVEQFISTFSDMTQHAGHIDLHHGLAPQITLLDENQASGIWRLHFQLLHTEMQLMQIMGGVYEDKYRRVDSKWKIETTNFKILANTMLQKNNSGAFNVIEMGAVSGLSTEMVK
ncbi:MAG: nuclear transport factor 2 family protein [Gammaproteobacteria bacterium]|nr:nuclear transport factor 2 family protein [Gammaproteobacteria bacterium]